MVSAASYGRVRTARRGRTFFLVMPMVLAGIAVLGFSHTLPGDVMATGFPPLLWVHAAVFIAWLALSVVQPVLIRSGSRHLHRQLGWAGAALACSMVGTGATAILLALWANAVPPFYPHALFLVRGMVALLLFAGLVCAGVLNRKRSGWHRRFMLYASVIVVLPGLERAMPVSAFGANWPFAVDAVLDLIALAGPAVDLIEERRVHPAYVWGLGAIVLGQLSVYALAPSGLATSLLHAFGTG